LQVLRTSFAFVEFTIEKQSVGLKLNACSSHRLYHATHARVYAGYIRLFGWSWEVKRGEADSTGTEEKRREIRERERDVETNGGWCEGGGGG
jgi:hypothetical protein